MRRLIALASVLSSSVAALAQDVAVPAPIDRSVTIYRAPDRDDGGIELDDLAGFALISETRELIVPAGTSRLRFEGVADGIDPASAIVTGLPSGVIEKNRDAQLLSPSALIAAAVGQPVMLVRSNPKTGGTVRMAGVIRSDAEGGVVFETAEGIEALRCSGLSESFTFAANGTGLSAQPTLSVLTRSDSAIRATVMLSYLARGFDWAADYVATLSPDGRTIDLGAWVTLANGNGVAFPDSRANVVAGRLNRDTGEVEPVDAGTAIIARCWPRGSTSDTPDEREIDAASPEGYIMAELPPPPAVAAPMAMAEIMVTARKRVEQEQLGDLKLYRVPDRTSVGSRQIKQVRLLDRHSIPVERIYGADLLAHDDVADEPAASMLRTKNDAAHGLGLPLPSGKVALFEPQRERSLLIGEADLRDIAIDEDVELKLGTSSEVRVRQLVEDRVGGSRASSMVEISNALPRPILFELRLRLVDGARIVTADHKAGSKNGRPIFRFTVAAGEKVSLRYQTEQRR